MVSCLQLKRMGERESQCSQRLALMSYLLISLSTAAIAYTFTADVSTGSAAYALLLFHPIMCSIYIHVTQHITNVHTHQDCAPYFLFLFLCLYCIFLYFIFFHCCAVIGLFFNLIVHVQSDNKMLFYSTNWIINMTRKHFLTEKFAWTNLSLLTTTCKVYLIFSHYLLVLLYITRQ